MTNQEVKILVEKYIKGQCTAHELAMLESWYINHEEHALPGLNKSQLKRIQDSLPAQYHPLVKIRPLWLRISVAAVTLIFLTTAAYFILGTKSPQLAKQPIEDIKAGGNKAILTLANGQKILLDSITNGKLAEQNGIVITKASDGTIVYNTLAVGSETQELSYNRIETPRGGQYQVILPDGSKVWLNAASSLRYPTAFVGAERRVELTGEAYFEVAKDKSKPFFVKTTSQEIEVLGTHFNINSYTDEDSAKTTLLEGSVRVHLTGTGKTGLLQPGEQAVVTDGGRIRINQADTEAEVAWKNGEFIFNGQDLQTVMRILSRWYDIDVAYIGKPAAVHFEGEVSRFRSLSAVIKMLEATNEVKFKIEGRRMTVMK